MCRKHSSSDLVQLALRLQQQLALGPPAPLPLLLLQLELLPLALQLRALSLDAFTADFALQVTIYSLKIISSLLSGSKDQKCK